MIINLRNIIVDLNILKKRLSTYVIIAFIFPLQNLPEMLNVIRYYPASQMSRLLSDLHATTGWRCCTVQIKPCHFTPFVSHHHVLCPMMHICL